jgi:hypothetical protein
MVKWNVFADDIKAVKEVVRAAKGLTSPWVMPC